MIRRKAIQAEFPAKCGVPANGVSSFRGLCGTTGNSPDRIEGGRYISAGTIANHNGLDDGLTYVCQRAHAVMHENDCSLG